MRYLEGRPCAECGAFNDLELDHIDPGSKIHHNIWSWSKQRRDLELQKCQILCADCHGRKTLASIARKYIHGTLKMYDKYKCRCIPCVAKKRVQNAKRYKRAGRESGR